MNTQRLAALRISPLHLQQGLFASLALMITLIVVQQFAHWNQSRQITHIQRIYSHSATFAKASALKATDVGLSLQPVEDATDAVEQAPHQQSWVF
ncbi:hypothetical protein [Pseudomonas sp. LP_7_YM]|uniref:hypothetical protein n=1 Tax=Pseudomonas sp. LP_7_YM TaxID=2485137 RepID=UPI00105D5C24|nr:hypothetical protein [Pseudomonas sp. LP_7_YM]TDV59837.1 hypothetical protein EC915_11427 [Pseudomonas sp. LP_7_YM]